MTQASAGAMHWSKTSENRFCERSAKAIGLSEALVERQLAWASRGHRWHTRWISWGSPAHQSEQFSPVFQKSASREIADVIVQQAIALLGTSNRPHSEKQRRAMRKPG